MELMSYSSHLLLYLTLILSLSPLSLSLTLTLSHSFERLKTEHYRPDPPEPVLSGFFAVSMPVRVGMPPGWNWSSSGNGNRDSLLPSLPRLAFLRSADIDSPHWHLFGVKGRTLMTSHVEKEAGRGHSLDSEAEGAGVRKDLPSQIALHASVKGGFPLGQSHPENQSRKELSYFNKYRSAANGKPSLLRGNHLLSYWIGNKRLLHWLEAKGELVNSSQIDDAGKGINCCSCSTLRDSTPLLFSSLIFLFPHRGLGRIIPLGRIALVLAPMSGVLGFVGFIAGFVAAFLLLMLDKKGSVGKVRMRKEPNLIDRITDRIGNRGFFILLQGTTFMVISFNLYGRLKAQKLRIDMPQLQSRGEEAFIRQKEASGEDLNQELIRYLEKYQASIASILPCFRS
ncbi:hypothetical protein STAS_14734 [Striga asiatica]|uniref:Uncharacterized protein n=1 Tax=Striga asiatica TaxID=4170 RepID=A0A5A7Q1M4_STRAF|nr:hypothetical protein STAS_14734 [Striga asiatica]